MSSGQDRAGQSRAGRRHKTGLGWTRKGRALQGWRLRGRAGHGRALQGLTLRGRAGQDRALQGWTLRGRAGHCRAGGSGPGQPAFNLRVNNTLSEASPALSQGTDKHASGREKGNVLNIWMGSKKERVPSGTCSPKPISL